MIAHVFGVTKARVRQLVKDGMPKSGRNRYPLVACVRWYISWWKNRAEITDRQVEKHQRRLIQAKADKAEMEVKIKRGELVHSEQVKNSALKTGVMIRTLLETIGNKVAPVLVDLDTPAAIADVINREIKQVLSKLADELKRI